MKKKRDGDGREAAPPGAGLGRKPFMTTAGVGAVGLAAAEANAIADASWGR